MSVPTEGVGHRSDRGEIMGDIAGMPSAAVVGGGAGGVALSLVSRAHLAKPGTPLLAGTNVLAKAGSAVRMVAPLAIGTGLAAKAEGSGPGSPVVMGAVGTGSIAAAGSLLLDTDASIARAAGSLKRPPASVPGKGAMFTGALLGGAMLGAVVGGGIGLVD